MTQQPRRRAITAGIVFALLLAMGAGIAFEVSGALGIRVEDSDIPTEKAAVAAETPFIQPPSFTLVDVSQEPRLTLAVDELADATSKGTSGRATLAVSHGDDAGADDTYTLGGTRAAITISAPGLAGAVRGVYDLAAAARSGHDVAANLGQTITSKLPFRMVDLGAVGVEADPAEWAPGTDYSHYSEAFADVILPEAPYIDEDALAEARGEFEQYVAHTLADGYNAIAIPGFIEYLTFSAVGDGNDVYPAGDEHVARAEAMQQAFGPLWKYAHDMGMKVYFRTDMLSLSTPLQSYLEKRFGSLDAENPELWGVYSAGLDELYESMPYIDGTLLRVGEGGKIYNLPGWDYYSEITVTTTKAVRAMLTAFTTEAEDVGREVIFRTWSVGIGAVGDMHTNPISYSEVLDGIDSPALIVSTKYSLGDFYSYLPLNDTLEHGDQRRIIEMQSRREFESFGSFPNDLGSLYSTALSTFLAANPHIEGIWTWTQDGGPWRAGPMTLELKTGFWQLYELNTELAVTLARDPAANPADITADWARRWFSHDPATVRAIGEAMASSREAITQGMYIAPFAEKRVFAVGLEPPPQMWLFEWDILTGDSATLDVIYHVSKDRLAEAVAGGEKAVAAVDRMRDAIDSTDSASWSDPAMRAQFVDSLDYEHSTLTMVGSYRTMVLRQAEWHDTASPAAYRAWMKARDAFVSAAHADTDRYGDGADVGHPAFNLTAAWLGVDRADRDLAMAWMARVVLALILIGLLIGALPARWRLPGRRVVRTLAASAVRPWRASEFVAALSRRERIALLTAPVVLVAATELAYAWFEAWSQLVVSFGAWIVFAAVLALALRGRSPWGVIAAVGGAAIVRSTLLAGALSITGPGGYWFAFWTDPARRSSYIVVAFALFGWMLACAFWALAAALGRRRAAGWTLAAAGAVIAVIGGIVALVGLESSLTVWIDQMGVMPWGLHRILGITTYLGIPTDSALVAAIAGAILAVIGLALALLPRLLRPVPSGPAPSRL